MPEPTSLRTLAIPTTIHGRCLLRRAAREPAGLLVGFHGYAQNAATCLADLEAVPGTDGWTAVAVQGLHRFYTRSGDVVASWMTREDRDLAIWDNIDYVRAVLDRVHAELHPGVPVPPGRAPIVFAGFSQGVAMAFRAAINVEGCIGIIALGGDVPPDVKASNRRLPPVLLGRGADDEWYRHETFESDVAWLASTEVDLTLCEFDGGHCWTEAFRAAAGAFLERRRADCW